MPPVIPADSTIDPALTPPDDSTAWEAFCYLTDAMTPAEIASFERRLDHDQAARLALAAAVDSLGAIAIVADEWIAAAPTATLALVHRSRRLARATLAAGLCVAAALLMAAVGTLLYRSQPNSDRFAVAVAWTDVRNQSGSTDPNLSFGFELSAAPDPIPVDADAPEIAEVFPEQPVASWILATVAPTRIDPNSPLSEGN